MDRYIGIPYTGLYRDEQMYTNMQKYVDMHTCIPMFRLRYSDKYYKCTNNQCFNIDILW